MYYAVTRTQGLAAFTAKKNLNVVWLARQPTYPALGLRNGERKRCVLQNTKIKLCAITLITFIVGGVLYGEVPRKAENTGQHGGLVADSGGFGRREQVTQNSVGEFRYREATEVTADSRSIVPDSSSTTTATPGIISSGGVSRGGTQRGVPLGTFTITFYTAGPESTGKAVGDADYGITATGTTVKEGRTAAADWDVLPPGSLVYIEGIGLRYIEDCGGGVNGKHIDVLVTSEAEALQLGKVTRKVYLVRRGSN